LKAYLFTILALDFENYGVDSAIMEISNIRGTSCKAFSPIERDIGEWTDDHPLNHKSTWEAEVQRLFDIPVARIDGSEPDVDGESK